MTLVWSSSLDSWQSLKLELQLEADAIFTSSGEVVVVAPDSESGSVLKLVSGTKSLTDSYVPGKNVVRWDTDSEYSFERIPEEIALLAGTLMQRLRR